MMDDSLFHPSFRRLNKIGKQNPNLHGSVADHDEDDDGSPDMTAIVSALAQQQQRVRSPTRFQFILRPIYAKHSGVVLTEGENIT